MSRVRVPPGPPIRLCLKDAQASFCYDVNMSIDLQPSIDAVIDFTKLLAVYLKDVPELDVAIKLAADQPKLTRQLVTKYAELISYMARLTHEEQDQIQAAKRRLFEQNGEMGSAAEVCATELIQEISDQAVLPELMQHILDVDSTTEEALQILQQRMLGGHQMKIDGKTPRDGDEESNKVIWGHTQITDSSALLHFTFCHYLEQYYTIALLRRHVSSAEHKDFFLNAMIDAVIVDHLGDREFQGIYDIWVRSKPVGLGWIVPARLNSYLA